uniref:Protein kinase domain-containing protein n=1 Tax=viral metagenome TaxID=1070528 RepID=A0A6C0BDY2_9ZZZZ
MSWCGKIIEHKQNTYIPVYKIGEGSFAQVWMVYNVKLKQMLAMKIFNSKEKKSAQKEYDLYEKFTKMGIRNIIKAYAYFTFTDNIMIVFDLMAGSLYDVIKYHTFSDDDINKIAKSSLETLDDLHTNNIIHGDVKPENILIYGQNTIHKELLEKLSIKSSNKKISETIKEYMYKYDLSDSSSESSSETDSSETDSSTCGTDLSSEIDKLSINFSKSSKSSSSSSKSSSSSSKSSSSSSNYKKTLFKNHCLILDKYLLNPSTKLSDFGNSINVTDLNKPPTIHTIYYRSPEILLGLPYDTKSDIWALGCTLYEIQSKKILFNPDKSSGDEKRTIIHLMYSVLGPFPEKMIDVSPLKEIFFTNKYLLKGSSYIPFSDNVFFKYMYLLTIDPQDRPTAKCY